MKQSASKTSYRELAALFARIGATAFGGWSTTALLLEKELVDKRNLLDQTQLKGAVAYAQILPGATQVSMVANAGYRLRGVRGATIATLGYLLPAVMLAIAFSAAYFHYATDSSQLLPHLDGLIAALSGVILANAYRIGGKHAATTLLWVLPIVAFFARLAFGINALFIIVAFGAAGIAYSLLRNRRAL